MSYEKPIVFTFVLFSGIIITKSLGRAVERRYTRAWLYRFDIAVFRANFTPRFGEFCGSPANEDSQFFVAVAAAEEPRQTERPSPLATPIPDEKVGPETEEPSGETNQSSTPAASSVSGGRLTTTPQAQ